MPKIRHIALATKDPQATAEFYKKAFGFKEVARTSDAGGRNTLAHGIYLSDGTLNLAILKFEWDQLGKGLDYVGVHHFGILVDEDVDSWIEKLETLGAECFLKRDPNNHSGAFFETKFRGPDGVVFDVADHPWAGSAPSDADTASTPKATAAAKSEAAD